jgi:hypothetical protein
MEEYLPLRLYTKSLKPLKMDAYDAYKTYLALKSHFTSKTYDFIKYGGRTRASKDTFEKRHDKYYFHKLSKRKDVVGFLVANFVYNAQQWAGELLQNNDAEKYYVRYQRYRESMAYQFASDLDKLNPSFNNNVLVTEGQHPLLLKLFLRDEINIETLVILDDLLKFMKHWNKSIDDRVVWPDIYLRCKKYKPFLEFDRDKMKKIVLDKFSETQ